MKRFERCDELGLRIITYLFACVICVVLGPCSLLCTSCRSVLCLASVWYFWSWGKDINVYYAFFKVCLCIFFKELRRTPSVLISRINILTGRFVVTTLKKTFVKVSNLYLYIYIYIYIYIIMLRTEAHLQNPRKQGYCSRISTMRDI